MRWGVVGSSRRGRLRDLRPSCRSGLCASPSMKRFISRGHVSRRLCDPRGTPRMGCAPATPAGVKMNGVAVRDFVGASKGAGSAPALSAHLLRPLNRRLFLRGLPSDSPRGGPSTRLRMYCAPATPAGASFVEGGGGLCRGVRTSPSLPLPLREGQARVPLPFHSAKGRLARRGTVDDSWGRTALTRWSWRCQILRSAQNDWWADSGLRLGVGGGREIASSLGAPRNDGCRWTALTRWWWRCQILRSAQNDWWADSGLRLGVGGGREIASSLGASRHDRCRCEIDALASASAQGREFWSRTTMQCAADDAEVRTPRLRGEGRGVLGAMNLAPTKTGGTFVRGTTLQDESRSFSEEALGDGGGLPGGVGGGCEIASSLGASRNDGCRWTALGCWFGCEITSSPGAPRNDFVEADWIRAA